MIRKACIHLASVSLLGIAAASHAQVSMFVNGDLVVGAGDIETIVYSPDRMELEITTFHRDLRCSGVVPQSPGNIKLIIDRVGVNEEDAEYSISLNGSVIYSFQNGEKKIEIQTDGIEATAGIDCTHKFPAVGEIDLQTGKATLGAFAVHDFEELFSLTVDPVPGNVGFDLILKNPTPLFAAKNVEVALGLSVGAPGLFPVPNPQFESFLVVDDPSTPEIVEMQQFGSVNEATGIWGLPALWPSETALLKIRYDSLRSNDTISLNIGDIKSHDRIVNPFNPLITVVNTSTTTTVQ